MYVCTDLCLYIWIVGWLDGRVYMSPYNTACMYVFLVCVYARMYVCKHACMYIGRWGGGGGD